MTGAHAGQTSKATLSVLLQALADDDSRERISVGGLPAAMSDRALAARLFDFAGPTVLPVPPGTSAILGAPLVFLTSGADRTAHADPLGNMLPALAMSLPGLGRIGAGRVVDPGRPCGRGRSRDRRVTRGSRRGQAGPLLLCRGAPMKSLSTLATCADSRTSGSASNAKAGHGCHVRSKPSLLGLVPAIALTSLCLLTACGQEPDLPPLPPAQLNSAQSEALQQMNSAGTTAFAGWTWRYEFGAGCRIRVIKRYEGRPVPVIEYTLTDHYAEIVPYAGVGYGVKAYPRAKPGSADLFEAGTEPLAAEFASNVERLLTACSSTITPNR